MSDGDSTVDRLGRALGHRFVDAPRAERALSHPSYSHEAAAGDRGNERLEFLGDAVLDLVVGEALYHAHPDWPEGRLTRARAAWVRRESLADRAREIGLPELVRLGRTELLSGGAEKDSILANTLEAVVGALYLDGGLAPVERLVRGWLDAEADGRGAGARDAKTAFQEWAHARFRETPSYHTVTDSGVDADEERFTVEVRVSGEAWGEGTARSKRLAERAAAEDALARADSA
ncbi:MAG: ribonuclease III [Myxococcota bacterium]